MPKFRATLPDGRTVEAEAPDAQSFADAVDEMAASIAPQAVAQKQQTSASIAKTQQPSAAESFGRWVGKDPVAGEFIQSAGEVPVGLVQFGANMAASAPYLKDSATAQILAQGLNDLIAKQKKGYQDVRMEQAQPRIDALRNDPKFQEMAARDPKMAQYFLDREMPGTTLAGVLGSLAGGAKLPVPQVAKRLPGRAAVGAGTGALYSQAQTQSGQGGEGVTPEQFAEEATARALIGGGVGGALPVAGRVASRAVGGVGGENIQRLRSLGVSPTIGQTIGLDFEKALTSVPVAGGVVAKGFEGVSKEFTEGMAGKALSHIGGKPVPGKGVNDLVRNAGDQISAFYEKTLSRAKPAYPDPTLMTDVRTDLLAARQLPADREAYVQKLMANISRKTQGAKIDGPMYKEIDSDLNAAIRNATDTREADILREVKGSFRDWFGRKNPDLVPDVRRADAAWAELVPLEGSVTNMPAGASYPSPARFRQEMKKQDSSTRKRAVSRGEALNQEEIDAAADVMRTMPDSGTGGRLPWSQANVAALVAGGLSSIPATIIYSDQGRRSISALLSQRPEYAQPVANFIEGFAAGPQRARIASILASKQRNEQ